MNCFWSCNTFATPHLSLHVSKGTKQILGSWPFKLFATTQVTSDASPARSPSQLPSPAYHACVHACMGDPWRKKVFQNSPNPPKKINLLLVLDWKCTSPKGSQSQTSQLRNSGQPSYPLGTSQSKNKGAISFGQKQTGGQNYSYCKWVTIFCHPFIESLDRCRLFFPLVINQESLKALCGNPKTSLKRNHFSLEEKLLVYYYSLATWFTIQTRSVI